MKTLSPVKSRTWEALERLERARDILVNECLVLRRALTDISRNSVE